MDVKQVINMVSQGPAWQSLADFTLGDEAGIEGAAARQVTEILRQLEVPPKAAAQIKAAVAHAAREVIERCGDPEPPLRFFVRVMGLVGGSAHSDGLPPADEPDHVTGSTLPAQSPALQGWGFFLVGRAARAGKANGNRGEYTIELFLYPEGSRLGEVVF